MVFALRILATTEKVLSDTDAISISLHPTITNLSSYVNAVTF